MIDTNYMFSEFNVMASYLDPCFIVITHQAQVIKLGSLSARVEMDGTQGARPPREQRVCRHCSVQASVLSDQLRFRVARVQPKSLKPKKP